MPLALLLVVFITWNKCPLNKIIRNKNKNRYKSKNYIFFGLIYKIPNQPTDQQLTNQPNTATQHETLKVKCDVKYKEEEKTTTIKNILQLVVVVASIATNMKN